jgi:ABC-type tungstate transport system substrate-binding protein
MRSEEVEGGAAPGEDDGNQRRASSCAQGRPDSAPHRASTLERERCARSLCRCLHIDSRGGPADNDRHGSHGVNEFAQSARSALDLIVHADANLVRTVTLSLVVSGAACLFAAGFGLLGGAWLAVARFPGLRAALLLLNTLLALPSVVVGLVVYLLLSRSGPLGHWGILFTPSAMVIAQTILVVPLVAALARQVVADSLRDGGDPLRSLGAGPLLTALLMLLHERWAVVTILLTAFGRAIAEVGAVMIVGGNIEGVTRVMTTTIALETSKGDLPLALALGLVLLAVVGLLNLAIGLVRGRYAAVRVHPR